MASRMCRDRRPQGFVVPPRFLLGRRARLVHAAWPRLASRISSIRLRRPVFFNDSPR